MIDKKEYRCECGGKRHKCDIQRISALLSEVRRKDESIQALLDESYRIWKVLMSHGLEDEVTASEGQTDEQGHGES